MTSEIKKKRNTIRIFYKRLTSVQKMWQYAFVIGVLTSTFTVAHPTGGDVSITYGE